jgi:hypothetical protein
MFKYFCILLLCISYAMAECNMACLWSCIEPSECPATCHKNFSIEPLESIEVSTIICGNDHKNTAWLGISASSLITVTFSIVLAKQYTLKDTSFTFPTTISSCTIPIPPTIRITNMASISNNITITKEIKDPTTDDKLVLILFGSPLLIGAILLIGGSIYRKCIEPVEKETKYMDVEMVPE